MGGVQGLDHFEAAALARGETDEAVRLDRARDPPHPLEAEGDTLTPADLLDHRENAPGAVLAGKLADEIFIEGKPLARDVGIEEEGVPSEAHFELLETFEGAAKPPQPEMAPRADEVVDDLDMENGASRGRDGVHVRLRVSAETSV